MGKQPESMPRPQFIKAVKCMPNVKPMTNYFKYLTELEPETFKTLTMYGPSLLQGQF